MVSTRGEPVIAPVRVLFVCTANISRSPYAERRAAQFVPAGSLTPDFSSAGLPGLPGEQMDSAMERELVDRGGSGAGHVSRQLSDGVLDECDVVLTVEFAHRLGIFDDWPQYAPKVFGLRQLADALARVDVPPSGGLAALDAALGAAQPDSFSWDIADPYRRGARAARACADQVDAALTVIVPALAGIPAGHDDGRHRKDSATQLGGQAPRW